MRSLRPQRILTAIAITAAATVLVAGDVAAAPNAVKAHVNGTGTIVGHCVGADSNVRLTAEATMAGAHLGAGTAAWTTCVDFGSHYVSDPPQTFTFNTEGFYNFICSVHTRTMFGTVTVGAVPAPPPS